MRDDGTIVDTLAEVGSCSARETGEALVKKCVSCTKDLPDTALHCVFCGAKQPAAPAPGAPPPAAPPATAKTVMGYSAAELLKNLPKPAAPAPAPAPPHSTAPGRGPAPMGSSPMQPPPAPAPAPPPAAMASTAFAQQSPFMQQPQPPPAAPPPAAQAKTMFMDQGPAQPPGPAPMGHSPMQHPPPPPMQHQPPPPAQFQPPPMQHQPPPPAQFQPPPMHPPLHGGPGGTAIVSAPPAPYAPSATAALSRAGEPLAGGLQLVLIIFGVVLLAAFVTPIRADRETLFWWDSLDDLDGKYKLMPILLAAAGLLGVLLGSIPLPSTGRAVAASVLGITPLVYASLAINPESDWQPIASAAGMFLIPAGLLLRAAVPSSMLARILTTLGALAVLAVWLVPVHDKIPIQAALDVLDTEAKAGVKAGAIAPLLYPLLAIVSLLVWIPGPGPGGAKVLAWLWILSALIVHFMILIAAGEIGDALEESPHLALFSGLEQLSKAMGPEGPRGSEMVLLIPSGVVASAYAAFAGYGLATLLGKR
jgi:hypothetical protein